MKLKTIDLNSNSAVLAVHYEGKALYNINLENPAGDLVGKSQTEVNDILRSRAEIDSLEITLAPSWQKAMPWFKSKIEVKMEE